MPDFDLDQKATRKLQRQRQWQQQQQRQQRRRPQLYYFPAEGAIPTAKALVVDVNDKGCVEDEHSD